MQRLRTLEQAGIVERAPNPAGRGSAYHLTKAGAELEGVLDRLAIWAQRWIELREDCLDAAPLMQAIKMHLKADAIPIGPTVVRFDFTDPGQRSYWMLLRRPESELCFHDPGQETDMVVTCDVEALTRVFLGRVPLARATARERIRLDGPSDLVTGFPRWLGLHKFASYGARLAAAS